VRLDVASPFARQCFASSVTIVVRACYVAVRILVLGIVMLFIGVYFVVLRFAMLAVLAVFFLVSVILCLVRFGVVRDRLAGQNLGNHGHRSRSRGMAVRIPMPMTVIVIFEIFEDVADVQEGVAIQADVDEGGLHAWKDAGDAAFVNTPDQREFLFALNINFD
jgi:NADH:ubiquinone oxidoreductase subunit 6 (subunit J)